MTPTVKAIADAAARAADEALRANFIHISMLSGWREVRLQMYLGGEPQTWINYDAEQMDELIRVLQASREEMTL